MTGDEVLYPAVMDVDGLHSAGDLVIGEEHVLRVPEKEGEEDEESSDWEEEESTGGSGFIAQSLPIEEDNDDDEEDEM